MKRVLFFTVITFVALAAQAQWGWGWDNYPPDNENVTLTQTNLPIVFITVNGEIIDREERITGHMKIIDNGAGELNYADTLAHPNQKIDYEGYIAIRYRGNSSFTNSDKKPYSFRTMTAPIEDGGQKVKVKIMGMPKDNNWALLAPYSDKSMMRDVLAFELSRPWMDYVPRAKFCEMFLDGTYYGVYVMTEVVSKGKHRLNLEDPGTEGDALTGGYLVEVDRTDEVTHTSNYHPVNAYGWQLSNQYINFQYKEPEYEEMTTEQIDYINGRIDQMEAALYSSNYKDPETGYRQYLDPMSFVDYQLAQELGHNVDGYRLSAKMFKRNDSLDPHFKMVLWDMNLAYGNSDYYNGWYTNTWVYQNNNLLNSQGDTQLVPFWWYKLNKDDYYVDMLKRRWAQYRRSNLSDERIMATVDSLANVLTVQGAERRNSQAWPRWGQYVWPNKYVSQNFDDEISYLKGWIADRIEWMDTQLEFDPTELVGDVNLDGAVDIVDVNIVINIILDQNHDADQFARADLNYDETVDVIDMNTLINIILAQ